MSLASRVRARFTSLFPQGPPKPKPGPAAPSSTIDSAAKHGHRIVVDPIHPDFYSRVDPLWPIPEESLKQNDAKGASATRKLHPHTAFGRTGFGIVEVPESISSPIRALVNGNSHLNIALIRTTSSFIEVCCE